jgi:type II secretory pathway pseudopilin PulG
MIYFSLQKFLKIEKRKILSSTSGFTLIETVVYLALFGFIMSGAVLSAYQLIEASGRSNTRAMLSEEGDFISAKIDWVLSGVQTVVTPVTPTVGGECTVSNTLSVVKWDTSVGTVVVAISSSDLTLSKEGGPADVLNNSNMTVSNMNFVHCYLGGTNPESVEAHFTLSARTPNGTLMSKDFFTSDYIHR